MGCNNCSWIQLQHDAWKSPPWRIQDCITGLLQLYIHSGIVSERHRTMGFQLHYQEANDDNCIYDQRGAAWHDFYIFLAFSDSLPRERNMAFWRRILSAHQRFDCILPSHCSVVACFYKRRQIYGYCPAQARQGTEKHKKSSAGLHWHLDNDPCNNFPTAVSTFWSRQSLEFNHMPENARYHPFEGNKYVELFPTDIFLSDSPGYHDGVLPRHYLQFYPWQDFQTEA